MRLPVTPAQRNLVSLLLLMATCFWFLNPLQELWSFALREESFSYIIFVPLISGYLLVSKRSTILISVECSPVLGLIVLLLGVALYWSTIRQETIPDDLPGTITAFVLVCWGIVLGGFGKPCFRENSFALLFLLGLVPIPAVILDAIVGFLQQSSAEVVAVVFSVLDIPVFRQGFIFSLSRFTIHVAEECSGIRSFLSLVIVSLLAGHWFLRSGWTKILLTSCIVPLAIIKNAFRIVGLTILANYVDPTYITNSLLHRAGGIPLFLISLFVLAGLVWGLRWVEQRGGWTTASLVKRET